MIKSDPIPQKPESSPTLGETASFGFRDVPEAEKAGLVGEVFARVADRYDIMNDAMSLGIHRLWKDAMMDWLRPRSGLAYLDLAGGTGDIAFRLQDRVKGDAEITVSDINPDMLRVGRDRALDQGRLTGLTWLVADAEDLPLADRSMDAVTMAFGIRNCTHIDRVLAEAHRVLKPTGRFLCLEFSTLAIPALQKLYDQYSFHVVPWLGEMIAKDRDSYVYLVESIRRFPDQAAFARMFTEAGFEQVAFHNLTGGIAALHSGWRI